MSAAQKPAKRANAPRAERPRRTIENLSGLLDRIVESADAPDNAADGHVSIREILAYVGRRSYGPLLLFIGLFSISPATIVPGMTWLSAGMTLLVAGQMALGRPYVWLPRLDASFKAQAVRGAAEKLRPWARRIDAVLKPRLCFLSSPPAAIIIALLCIAAALVTFPLGFIPVAPVAPGLAVALFGLGMTARDGVAILLGTIPGTIAGLLVWPFVLPFILPLIS
jgi:hypothetical protein